MIAGTILRDNNKYDACTSCISVHIIHQMTSHGREVTGMAARRDERGVLSAYPGNMLTLGMLYMVDTGVAGLLGAWQQFLLLALRTKY